VAAVTEKDNFMLRAALLKIAQSVVALANQLLSRYDQERKV
jgi:hypothetical protein